MKQAERGVHGAFQVRQKRRLRPDAELLLCQTASMITDDGAVRCSVVLSLTLVPDTSPEVDPLRQEGCRSCPLLTRPVPAARYRSCSFGDQADRRDRERVVDL